MVYRKDWPMMCYWPAGSDSMPTARAPLPRFTRVWSGVGLLSRFFVLNQYLEFVSIAQGLRGREEKLTLKILGMANACEPQHNGAVGAEDEAALSMSRRNRQRVQRSHQPRYFSPCRDGVVLVYSVYFLNWLRWDLVTARQHRWRRREQRRY